MLKFQRNPDKEFNISAVGQLIWREYFYTMSSNNLQYDQMESNPICLNIPWYDDEDKLRKWELVNKMYKNMSVSCNHVCVFFQPPFKISGL